VPSEDYVLTFNQLINFINGTGDLKGLPAELQLVGLPIIQQNIDIPPIGNPVIPELDGKEITKAVDSIDFSKVANFRFYVIGPNNDGWTGFPSNEKVGNYWFHSDTFPIVNNIKWQTMYMHQNGKLNYSPPAQDEGYTMYIHDPDDQVYTIGGANMIVDLPFGHKSSVVKNSRSQGQINLADPRWRHTTMDRPGVVAFETDVLTDTLCIIGFPEARLYAKSNPGGEVDGPTDTDFFVRILDVYPDGRQFFVVEGCVNARARDYAKALAEADGLETEAIDNIPFTNIDIGKIYEYHFRMMPIAYTWGYGHKLKILISSSNHTRYQVNPNLPIEDGDFFRRQPLDGQKYIFNGVEMEPRVAVQRIAHSPEYPTSIELPVYNKNYVGVFEPTPQNGSQMSILLYPNPATEVINIYMSKPNQDYELVMFNEIGQQVYTASFTEEHNINATRFDKGIYLIEVRDTKTNEKLTKKVTIQ
ncbi:MAG TPA: CocE/NonD family hydrolase, partial [Chitinophagales bacterium]|nr:CocE/NonD family hydrolase [Chitinophagales bacterium]